MTKPTWNLLLPEESQSLYSEAEERYSVFKIEEAVEKRAARFKALGDETRLKIVAILSVRDSCLCEIVDALESANSTITHHLKLLERGGVIRSRKEGKFTIFQLDPEFGPIEKWLGGGGQ